MELIEGLKTRRSIRNFSGKMVSEDLIREIVEISRFAPSWKNSQTPKYIAVTDFDIKRKIAKECVHGFEKNTNNINNASALIIVAYNTGVCGYNPDGTFTTIKKDAWEMFDAGLAVQTFCLAAHAKGLGSVILGIFDEMKIAPIIQLPEDMKIAALIPIGYPGEQPEAPKRKEVSELLSFI